jgi:hypothetical protein
MLSTTISHIFLSSFLRTSNFISPHHHSIFPALIAKRLPELNGRQDAQFA